MALIQGSLGGVFGGVSKQPDILRHPGQCTKQKNMWLDFSDGLLRRAALQKIKTLVNMDTVNASLSSYVHWFSLENVTYFAVFTGTDYRVYNISGVEQTRNFVQADYNYMLTPGFGTCNFNSNNISSIQTGDYSILANRDKVPAAKTTIASASAEDQFITIEVSIGLLWGLTYTILHGTTVAATVTTPDGATITPATLAQTNSTAIATSLRGQLITYLSGSGWIVSGTSSQNQIFMRRPVASITTSFKPEDFSIHDGDGNKAIKLTFSSVRSISDLPKKSSFGHWVKVQGRTEATLDNFYMEFVAESSGEGIWKECAEKNEPTELNPANMPHVLFRAANGTFYFSALDGRTVGGSVVDVWKPRNAGDSTSNPSPAFIGSNITGLTFVQGRLGILSEEHLNLSKSAGEFNFFSQSAITDTDSDPIEYAAPGSELAGLRHAVLQSRALTVFGKGFQYAIPVAGVLTRSSSAMYPTTAYPVQVDCKPVAAGMGVFFAFTDGEGTGIREYRDGLIESTNRAEDLTSHIPNYLPKNLRELVTDNENGHLVGYSFKSNTLFVYQFLLRDETYEISAWHEVSFKDLELHSVHVHQGELHIVGWLHGSLRLFKLEKVSEYLLDYSFDAVITDSTIDLTLFDLTFDEDDLRGVVLTGPYTGLGVEIASVTPTEGVIKEGHLLEGQTIRIGVPYMSEYTPTMPVIRDTNGKAQLKDTLKLNSLVAEVVDTGSFDVEVEAPHYDTTTQTFSGKKVGSTFIVGQSPVSSRSCNVFLGHNARTVQPTFKCDTQDQLRISSLEYTGTHTQRGRRY